MEKLEQIYKNNRITVYKGRCSDYEKDVALKFLNSEYPSEELIKRFENELKFTKNLNIKNIQKVLEKRITDRKHLLILEFVEGETIKSFINKKTTNLKSAIKIAIKIAETIGEIHQQNIIHNDINSNNILITDNNNIKIIDFGVATHYNVYTQNSTIPKHLEGTISYISPEHTGRMNKSIDHRSDLYSLGVVLYEFFTKKLPFIETDNMKLIHSHIAKIPVAPNKIDPSIPKILSDIILKLLSKNAKNRYQSAFGLKYDLQQLINQQEFENLVNFHLGEKDFSGKLSITKKLYGRENQIKKLLTIYDNVSKGNKELLLVFGVAGVGKSALIHKVQNPIIKNNGIVIEGKFDQIQKNTQYAAIIQAFTNFANLILKEDDKKLNYWKNIIQNAVGNVGRVLTNLIPELELIIGKQPALTELNGEESLFRFNYVWQNFVKAISQAKHPLVIFIDDLQWADNASVELLKKLLENTEVKHLLCVATYRYETLINSEIQTFDIFKNINISKIILENLNQDDIYTFVSDTLATKQDFKNLTNLIYSKTEGNILFVNYFLKKLYEENFLTFNFQENKWIWNLEEIKKQNFTDNVVKLLVNKIQKLPEKTQDILKIAACMGNKFDIKMLSIISKNDKQKCKIYLEPAISEKIIQVIDNQFFNFSHDRIQQAVYSTIPNNKKNVFHLQIGKLLLNSYDKNEIQKYIFEIVNQLNFGEKNFKDENEKKQFAKLNIQAANKAKQSAAYFLSYKYLKIASRLLINNPWTSDYNFTLNLFNKLAELAYLSGKYDEAKAHINSIIKYSKNILDSISAYCVLINIYRSQSKHKDAVDKGIDVLSKLGLNVEKNPHKIVIGKEYLKTKLAIGRKNKSFFEQLPLMTNKKQIAIIEIINAFLSSAFFSYPKLFPLITLITLRIFIKYGNTLFSPTKYISYSIVLAVMNKIDESIRFGEIAENLHEKYNDQSQKAKLYYLLNYFVKIRKEKLHATVKTMELIQNVGFENGDIEYASYGICIQLSMSIFILPLQQLFNKEIKKSEILKNTNHKFAIKHYQLSLQVCDNFINKTDEQCVLNGKYFNEQIEKKELLKDNDFNNLFFLNLFKMLLSLTFENDKIAETLIENAEKFTKIQQGSYYSVLNIFYHSLLSIQIYERTKNKKLLKKIAKNQKQMKAWANQCSINFQHNYLLIEAEIMRINGKTKLARELYDKTITAAHENHFLIDEALAWHISAKFYIKTNKKHNAKLYMQKAYNCYKKIETYAVCSHLKKEYSKYFLAKEKFSQNNNFKSIKEESKILGSSSLLDLSSIVKANQLLSQEVKLNNLLEKMLKLVMENAGADYAVFIENNNGKYSIQAKGKYNNKIQVLQSESIEYSDAVALNIVKYVIRTKKSIVVNNAQVDKKYNKDDYIKQKKLKSVFCNPIINKNKLIAILYLENSLSTHVFSSARIKIINIISSQIAVSYENALLYRNLEKTVELRTAQLSDSNSELQATNEELYEKNEIIDNQNNELKATLQNLRKAQSHLIETEKMASLGILTAGVAHEINNPLNYIMGGYVGLNEYFKENKIIDKKVNTLLYSLKTGINNAADIVKGLNQFSSSKDTFEEKCDIHSIIDNCLLMIRYQYKNRIKLEKNYSNEKIQTLGNNGNLHQVFLNILTNSVQAIKNKGKITIETKISDNNIVVKISDTGEGINKEDIPKITDPFFTTKDPGKGIGLGLSISYKIIKAHKGYIKFSSEKNEGTTVNVYLPINY
ncbi:MAG: AAA family ATPase [Bacteroidota bacterium]|nr:AAA family ATPase [Bacteroidota bacterium]